jgi:CBS-domain-containing membrane protein
MKISDIMTGDVLTLSPDDTIAKALNLMYKYRINQIPILDKYGNYQGMVFAKNFLNVNMMSTAKLKNFVSTTPVLGPSDDLKSTRLIVTTGNRALPVVEDSKLIGIISETDVILKTHFGSTIVDNVMADAIVIEEETALDSALAKMRRYNISRLPVVDSSGVLTGIVNPLDRAKIMATPLERISKDSRTSSLQPAAKQVKVKDTMRRIIPVQTGTRLRNVVERFKDCEELVVVTRDKARKPIGIVTPRDALETILPRQSHSLIHIANVSDMDSRMIIEEQIARFLKKIHGKSEDVQSVLVYVDKYKTRKYSIRARLIAAKHVIGAKAVGFDPLSASKKLVSILDKRTKSERGRKVRQRQQPSIRYPLP